MNKYIISQTATIKDSLVAINNISSDTQSLLVVDHDGKMVGTLTDGDIRRGLISGAELNDLVSTIMHRDYKYILQTEFDVIRLRHFREHKVYFIPILDEENRIVDVVNLQKYKSHLPIDAVLMAGGKGERLRPLTEKTPKPLLKVGNKSIIDYNIERLISYGISHLSVTVNYLKEQIEEHFSNPVNGVQVACVREPQYLGTIGSVRFVPMFYNDVVLVMNSDLFTNINYEDFYLHFKEHDADMAIAAVPYSVSVPYGIFELEGRTIQGIKEKPTYNYYANAGIYLIKKELFEYIPENAFYNATDFVELLIQHKKNVIRYPITGYWLDIGKHEEYRKAQELVKHVRQDS